MDFASTALCNAHSPVAASEPSSARVVENGSGLEPALTASDTSGAADAPHSVPLLVAVVAFAGRNMRVLVVASGAACATAGCAALRAASTSSSNSRGQSGSTVWCVRVVGE